MPALRYCEKGSEVTYSRTFSVRGGPCAKRVEEAGARRRSLPISRTSTRPRLNHNTPSAGTCTNSALHTVKPHPAADTCYNRICLQGRS